MRYKTSYIYDTIFIEVETFNDPSSRIKYIIKELE
jgi:hypothetical protein